MAEVPKLDIVLQDEGWDLSGGRSNNVWGRVDIPQELLDIINHSKTTPIVAFDPKTGDKIEKYKKAPVFTAYDDVIYSMPGKVKTSDFPKISATFKTCFDSYRAVTENLGMKIACALDMPTSYNYIVAFDPEQHPQIVGNYPITGKAKEPKPYGIVSIDFLANSPTPQMLTDKTEWTDEYGKMHNVKVYKAIQGDELVSFEDALRKYRIGGNKLNGDDNLIENWISATDEMVRKEMLGMPREKINKAITQVHSRIARAFLLREFLGDSDFTAYNCGVVVNDAKKTINFAPNHDFGEAFTSLVHKFTYSSDPHCGMTDEAWNALSEANREMITRALAKKTDKTVAEVAQSWASSTSEQNFYYVLQNFPDACEEFFESVDMLMQSKEVDKMVDDYTGMTINGESLLSCDEAAMFKEYIQERSGFMCDKYVQYLNLTGQPIPQKVSSEREK